MPNEKLLTLVDKETLEGTVDLLGVSKVLEMLAEICQSKADHIQANWQDRGLAREWELLGGSLAGHADAFKDL